MGANSSIEWCTHTFNPWWGCQRVSEGCTRCYAETLANRYGHAVWGPAKTTQRRAMSEQYWRQPLKWNRDAEQAGERARVFCASMADVFEEHPQLPPLRERLWTLIEQTPMLDWLLLTKRPEHIDQMLPSRWRRAEQGMPRNVWLGFSAEDQRRFDERWAIMEWLKRMWYPSIVFLSAEPLLGPLDISEALDEIDLGDEEHQRWSGTLDWVIVGGESGAQARPMHPDWVRSLRNQCQAAGIPFFFKQWGSARPYTHVDHLLNKSDPFAIGPDGQCITSRMFWRDPERYAGYAVMKRLGKKAAGRLLDGRAWNEFPNDERRMAEKAIEVSGEAS